MEHQDIDRRLYLLVVVRGVDLQMAALVLQISTAEARSIASDWADGDAVRYEPRRRTTP